MLGRSGAGSSWLFFISLSHPDTGCHIWSLVQLQVNIMAPMISVPKRIMSHIGYLAPETLVCSSPHSDSKTPVGLLGWIWQLAIYHTYNYSVSLSSLHFFSFFFLFFFLINLKSLSKVQLILGSFSIDKFKYIEMSSFHKKIYICHQCKGRSKAVKHQYG